MFLGDPRPIVDHSQQHLSPRRRDLGLHRDLPLSIHGVGGVHQQIDEDLHQLPLVQPHARRLVRADLELHLAHLRLMLDEPQRLLNGDRWGAREHLDLLCAAVVQQLSDDDVDALGRLSHLVEELAGFVLVGVRLTETLEGSQDRGQRVANLVRHTGRQSTDAGQLLRAHQTLAGNDQLFVARGELAVRALQLSQALPGFVASRANGLDHDVEPARELGDLAHAPHRDASVELAASHFVRRVHEPVNRSDDASRQEHISHDHHEQPDQHEVEEDQTLEVADLCIQIAHRDHEHQGRSRVTEPSPHHDGAMIWQVLDAEDRDLAEHLVELLMGWAPAMVALSPTAVAQ